MTAAEISALRAARYYIEAHRDELLNSYCIHGPDGTHDRASMDPDERGQVDVAEAIMAQIDAVLPVPPAQRAMEALVKRLRHEGFAIEVVKP